MDERRDKQLGRREYDHLLLHEIDRIPELGQQVAVLEKLVERLEKDQEKVKDFCNSLEKQVNSNTMKIYGFTLIAGFIAAIVTWVINYVK